ncbi:hypothetical protein PRBRB14_02210 [Hallella multisaccharivorax DSM 17128]|uniref:Uncharacterized protein n=1 Tax=Hallella multisaccharivorax DSM 17128 TaxID=688246 RepID=F8NAP5_9BACT|nr:hypothetical protein Premu_0363 [Hallella multisaccharivorax DSM 17128]GJG29342.1 hypothetical protein PRBRB14_02210 [Hallella multisaccharivorax DSM 17128]
MNVATKEFLTRMVNAEPKKGMVVCVKMEDALGKDIMAINSEVERNTFALVKMLVTAMSRSKELETVIRAAAYSFEYVTVEAIKIPAAPNKEEGGKA